MAKMEPKKKYYIDQLMKETNEKGVTLLALIKAAGKHIEQHDGKFTLTFDGEALRKEMAKGQQ